MIYAIIKKMPCDASHPMLRTHQLLETAINIVAITRYFSQEFKITCLLVLSTVSGICFRLRLFLSII